MLSDLRRDSEYVVGASAYCACTFTRTYMALHAFRDAKTRMKIILSVIVPSLKSRVHIEVHIQRSLS